MLLRNLDAVHDDLARDRGAQDSLPPIFGAERPGMPFSRMKPRIASPWAADFAQITKTSAMRRVGDPGLRAIEPVAVGDLFRARLHAGGIGAGIGLGQAEAADPLAGRELRQIVLASALEP